MRFIHKPICLLTGIWRSLRFGALWDGCDLVDEETDIPALVTVSRCKVCGRVDISWTRQ